MLTLFLLLDLLCKISSSAIRCTAAALILMVLSIAACCFDGNNTVYRVEALNFAIFEKKWQSRWIETLEEANFKLQLIRSPVQLVLFSTASFF